MSSIKLSKRQIGWDAMIADAKKRIQKLQTAILIGEENKKNGEPWPQAKKSATHN